MRKYHQKMLLDLLRTLSGASDDIKKLRDKNDTQALTNLLADCQDTAREIGEFIEQEVNQQEDKSPCQTVTYLEEYCDLLYQASVELANNDSGSGIVKKLNRQVIKIENSIKDDLKPDKIEVVFFPYKASMWDSLESIYLAAKDDPACDAYVVPIPYYEKNPDGSLGKMCFEGGEYPKDVPVVDYKTYNIEERRPDVVFIHNPYDNTNFVTSVHPDYYSHILREKTDCLIYIEYGIPYWMYRDVAFAHDEIKKTGKFLSVFFSCHHYIAYSKEVAEYFKTLFYCFPDIAKKHGVTQKDARERFVPLGSPKFDAVINTKRENCELPDKWEEKRNGKKVILYNSSLSEFLKSSAVKTGAVNIYFKKLRSIIDAFRSRDDVVLWWRPHPLFESSLRSMRPSLLDEYMAITQDFKTVGLGIFDDTDNLHRAVAWSDAMISDESSLLYLYTSTGKPFYIPSITMSLPDPIIDTGEDFHKPLLRLIENMRANKGANACNCNYCIWWHNFLEEDLMRNTRFDNFTERFIDFVVNTEKYPEAEEYRQLQIQMFKDFVANADGTAGQKIYGFVKEKILRGGGK